MVPLSGVGAGGGSLSCAEGECWRLISICHLSLCLERSSKMKNSLPMKQSGKLISVFSSCCKLMQKLEMKALIAGAFACQAESYPALCFGGLCIYVGCLVGHACW